MHMLEKFPQINNLLRLLSKQEQRNLYVLVIINTISALIEVLGVFSVLPFFAVAGNPDIINQSNLFSKLYHLGGFSSHGEFVVAIGLVTIGTIFLTNSVSIVSLWYRSKFCYNVVAGMADRLFRGYLTRPYEFFLSRNTSVLSKDLLNEVNAFFTNVLDPVTNIIARGLQLSFVAIALLIYNWVAAVSVALLFGGFYTAVYLVLQRRLQRIGEVRWACNEERHRLSNEALNGIKEIRLFGRESWYVEKFKLETFRVASLQGRVSVYGVSPRYLIETVAFGALITYIILSILNGATLTGVLPMLGVFAVAGMRVMPAIQIVFQFGSTLRANWITVERLQKLFAEANSLNTPPEIPQFSDERLVIKNSLEVKNISYQYKSTDKLVLKDVSFTIPAMACVGFCGTSGAGKTTLMDICLGLLETQAGVLLVDGVQIDNDTRRKWQRNIGYVPQQIYLLDGTIAENIAFGIEKDNIVMENVISAAKMASLHDFIAQLPNGYETGVGERGMRLSGGQRQRIAIARALYHSPEVLFFDEATSALDSETENMIVESIQALAHRKTIIIVAHRLSTLRYCDKIFTLDAGRIVKESTYSQLQAKN